ncbi:MAG: oligosaccharide flippase family protein [Pseudomonadota bacterium]|nr:oligosaccharide flippase family protein [Pseudomonadota bacterium]
MFLMIIRSGLWSIAGSAIEKLMLLATYVLVSRQVNKEQFGYLVIVFLIVEFLSYLSSFGVAENILRRKEISASFLASSYYFIVRIALAMVLLMALVAAPIAYVFYGNELFFLVLLMSVHPLFTCINSFYLALIQRDLRYKELALRTAVVSFSSGLTGVLLALSGAGVLSMIAGRYVQAVADYIWLRKISRYRNSRQHSMAEVKEIWHFGLPLSTAQVFNFASSRFYEIFVTLLFGPAVLAILDVGRKFLMTLYRFVFTPLNSVILTYLSRADRPEKAFFKAVSLVQLLVLPIVAAMGVLAEDLVFLSFGSEWEESAFVFQVFSVAGIAQSSTWFLTQLIIQFDKSSLVLKNNIIGFLSVFLVLLLGWVFIGDDVRFVIYIMCLSVFVSAFIRVIYVSFMTRSHLYLLLSPMITGSAVYFLLNVLFDYSIDWMDLSTGLYRILLVLTEAFVFISVMLLIFVILRWRK